MELLIYYSNHFFHSNTPSNTGPFAHFFNTRMNPLVEAAPGNCATENSLYELLDICILFYYAVGHKYIVKVKVLIDSFIYHNLLIFFLHEDCLGSR